MREHRREMIRTTRTTAFVVGAITLALALMVAVSVTAVSHWQALGR